MALFISTTLALTFVIGFSVGAWYQRYEIRKRMN